MIVIAFFVLHWYTSLFFQTFFLHRYAAHQMFTMSKTWEKAFFVLTWIFQGSNYLSAYGYGIMHRLHHAYADTENDPHSPKYSDNLWDMMWKTKKYYSQVNSGKKEIEEKFMGYVPEWKSFDNFAENYWVRIGWGVVYTLFYFAFAPSPWYFLLLPVHFLMAPVHGAIINWFAHKYGYKNFKVNDTSTNLLPVDILMMGEGYHNNHHKHGNRPNFGGVRWHEIDPTYIFIKLFSALGIIKMKEAKKAVVVGG